MGAREDRSAGSEVPGSSNLNWEAQPWLIEKAERTSGVSTVVLSRFLRFRTSLPDFQGTTAKSAITMIGGTKRLKIFTSAGSAENG